MVGAAPEGMGNYILLRVKMTLNAIFSAFLYHYIDSLYSLRLQGGGGAIAPLAP